MEILTIINTTIIICVFLYFFSCRFEIEIERTFFENKPYGLTLWFKAFPIRGPFKTRNGNHGKAIFYFNWRNPKNIPDDINKSKRRYYD